jgi:hypothetical protein
VQNKIVVPAMAQLLSQSVERLPPLTFCGIGYLHMEARFINLTGRGYSMLSFKAKIDRLSINIKRLCRLSAPQIKGIWYGMAFLFIQLAIS